MMKLYKAVDYQPRLEKLFTQLRSSLIDALGESTIEHIGSSSIPGALSKGDLDVLVIIPSEKFKEHLKILEDLGFKIKEDSQRSDYFCMLTTSIFEMDVAIQLVAENTDPAGFIKFRDILRAHPRLVNEYNSLKQDSAALEPDQYRAKKAEFIDSVLKSFQ